MTVQSTSLTPPQENEFQTGQVLPIAGAHFIHDVFTSFFPPLLPGLIEKLSLSLAQVGSLNAILQIGSLLNPLLGYMADKINMRYFVIFAPAVTATLMSLIGMTSSYYSLAAILFATGFSVAAFHAPAPAMIGRVAGRKIGLGMSIFMASGEMSRTVGPLLAVWAVSLWGLEGVARMMVLGWAASLILFWQLRGVKARLAKPGSLRSVLPILVSFFLPLAAVNFLRNFLAECLTTYLPTFLNSEGMEITQAGMALSLLEFAGVGGALLSGTLSDRLGRRSVLMAATLAPAALMPLFLAAEGWLLAPVLLLLGFTSLSATPVMLAMVQDQMPDNRAVGNGLFMVLAFVLRSAASLIVGALGDQVGLRQVFIWCALLTVLAIPAVLALPKAPRTVS